MNPKTQTALGPPVLISKVNLDVHLLLMGIYGLLYRKFQGQVVLISYNCLCSTGTERGSVPFYPPSAFITSDMVL